LPFLCCATSGLSAKTPREYPCPGIILDVPGQYGMIHHPDAVYQDSIEKLLVVHIPVGRNYPKKDWRSTASGTGTSGNRQNQPTRKKDKLE
jgi:hypothetical protein